MEQEKKELVARGYQFYCKGKEYYARNEIEGALINFLLALNTFDILKKLHVPGTASKDLKDLTLKCPLTENIDTAIDTLTRYISPLQDQLKRLKSTRGTADEDDNDCSTVANYIRKADDMITFDDISGQETTKSQLKSCLLYPLLYTRLFPQLSKGILLYGAPGTGKTMFAKAFVTELEMTAKEAKEDISIILYTPTGADLKGKYVGETEKNISKYFECAATRATECQTAKKSGRAISVIFMDEIEAIAGNRDDDSTGMMTNSVNTLLQKMDGVNSYANVIVMAATNYPWKLDEAVLRRFDTKIHVTLPEVEDIILLLKTEIVKKYFKPILRKEEEKTLVPDLPDPSACPIRPGFKERDDIAKMFNTYREEYFKDFEESDIRQYAKKLFPRYSAGDIANICKWVFRKMGGRALKDNRWDIHNKSLAFSEKYALYDPDNGQELGDSVIPQEDTQVPKEITIEGEVWIHSEYVVPVLRREGLKDFKDMNQKLDFIRSFYSLNTQNNKSYECFYVQKEFIKAKIEKNMKDVPANFELLVKQTIDMVNITAKQASFKPSFYVRLKCRYAQSWSDLYSTSKNKVKHFYRTLWMNYTAIDESDAINAPPVLPKDAGVFYVPSAFYIEQPGENTFKSLIPGEIEQQGDIFSGSSIERIELFDESAPIFSAFKRGLLYIPDDVEYKKMYKTSFSPYGVIVNQIKDGKIADMIDFLEAVLRMGEKNILKIELKVDLMPRKEKLKEDISNKYKLNLKFTIDDFYNAINTGKTDTIKPTVAPTKLALLKKYEQTGLLSKEDLTKAKDAPSTSG
jgi:SpoVK/Ycf46/Vps4 family AAA+-type ATPase